MNLRSIVTLIAATPSVALTFLVAQVHAQAPSGPGDHNVVGTVVDTSWGSQFAEITIRTSGGALVHVVVQSDTPRAAALKECERVQTVVRQETGEWRVVSVSDLGRDASCSVAAAPTPTPFVPSLPKIRRFMLGQTLIKCFPGLLGGIAMPGWPDLAPNGGFPPSLPMSPAKFEKVRLIKAMWGDDPSDMKAATVYKWVPTHKAGGPVFFEIGYTNGNSISWYFADSNNEIANAGFISLEYKSFSPFIPLVVQGSRLTAIRGEVVDLTKIPSGNQLRRCGYVAVSISSPSISPQPSGDLNLVIDPHDGSILAASDVIAI